MWLSTALTGGGGCLMLSVADSEILKREERQCIGSVVIVYHGFIAHNMNELYVLYQCVVNKDNKD